MKLPYIQTWFYVCRLMKGWPKTYRFVQWLCLKTTGHEGSLTEYGYGGGKMMDRWCRWCNYRFQVPTSEEPSKQYLVDSLEDEE